MDHEIKESIVKISLSTLTLIGAYIVERSFNLATWQLLLVYLIPYLIAGAETLKEAGESLLHLEPLDEDFLMSVATLGALAIGFMPGAEHQFPEAVFVMLFFQLGELFEGIAEGRSRKSISHLMDIRPDSANLEVDGQLTVVEPSVLKVGDIIVVKPGEKVPVDGEIIEGSTTLDTVALTGESVPRSAAAGDLIMSGCINLSGLVRVKVCRTFGESTASKILELVENAGERKSRSENFITKFARIYTPIVVALAVLLAIVPPLVLSGSFADLFPTWLYRALTFLIVSCPCALVISVPLAFFGGIGGASRKGVLIKGSAFIDTLAGIDTVVFDKTGTLTQGVFEVTALHPQVIDEKDLLHLAAHVERYSTHPVAVSLREAFGPDDDGCTVEQVEEIAGHGVRAVVNGKVVCVGNSRMMESVGAEWQDCDHMGTIVHVAIDGQYVGHIVISDRVKEDSASAITALHELGVSRLVMLTGDREGVAKRVAADLGLDAYRAELLPAGKVEELEKLIATKKGGLAFVGDGINDAPVLARADVGMAMGALGSDAAIEAADVVLMDDKPSKIAEAIRIARRTVRIARQNTVCAIAIKVAVLLLASLGLAGMWMAVFADVGVTVLAVLNSMRTLR